MKANVILGITIDTEGWIAELKRKSDATIIIVDYEYDGKPVINKEIIYMSILDCKIYLKKFDSIIFYKSLYVYPGMEGEMSSLYNKD